MYVCHTRLTWSPEVPERLLEGVSSAPRQAGGAVRVPGLFKPVGPHHPTYTGAPVLGSEVTTA